MSDFVSDALSEYRKRQKRLRKADDHICNCGICMYKGSEEYKCENCAHYTKKDQKEEYE